MCRWFSNRKGFYCSTVRINTFELQSVMGNVLEGYGSYINMEKYGKYQFLHMLDLIKCTDFFDIYDIWVKSGKKYRSPRLFRNVWKLWSSRWSPPFPQRDLVPLFQVNRLKSTTLAKNLTRQDNGSRKHGDHGESCELHLKNESYLLLDHHYMLFSFVKQRSHQLLLPTSVSRRFVSATPGLLVPHPGRFHPRRAWTAPGVGPSWGRKWWRLDPTFTLYIYICSHPK